MLKKKISKKHEFSLNDMQTVSLKNRKLVAKALWECLVSNDVDAFKEILKSHLEVTNKDDLAEKAGIPRRTLYRMLSPEGNPTLENLGKIIHELCA